MTQYPDPVADEAGPGAEEPPVRWLTAAELDSWLSVVRLISWLPWSIDQQLRRDSSLGMVEYQVMARLSQSPERTLRMSLLADLARPNDGCWDGDWQSPPQSPKVWSYNRELSV